MDTLQEIEQKIDDLIGTDKRRWVELYELMHEVDANKLYLEEYHSFTQWVNALAARLNVHVSLLWQRNKAGKFYSKYQEYMVSSGKQVKPLSDVSVTAEQLDLIEKISRGNNEIAEELIEKVDRNELKRDDLKNAWATVKGTGAVPKKNKYSTYKSDENESEMTDSEVKKDEITALDIVTALRMNMHWYGEEICKTGIVPKAKFFTEFGVETGTSHHERRIDLLLIENKTTTERHELNIHGIEIKVDKNDLIKDHKMQEYKDFCDYFYIAIPENLVEEAKKIALNEWGILSISADKKCEIIQKPTYKKGMMRTETFITACTKMI